MHRAFPVLKSLVLLLVLAPLPMLGADAAPPGTSRPRVLILGDSISIAYTPHVRRLLADSAEVYRPTTPEGREENCEGTTRGVRDIRRWLALHGGRWDLIHFNFGLHDLKRVNTESRANSDNPADPHQAEPEVYERQLREIVAALKSTGARLILATTTPVPEGKVSPYRDPADVPRYNAIARRVARENGIPVNDLFAYAEPHLADWQRPANVHFRPEGDAALGAEVARNLRAALTAD